MSWFHELYLHSSKDITPSLFLSMNSKNSCNLSLLGLMPARSKASCSSDLSIFPLLSWSTEWNMLHSCLSALSIKALNSAHLSETSVSLMTSPIVTLKLNKAVLRCIYSIMDILKDMFGILKGYWFPQLDHQWQQHPVGAIIRCPNLLSPRFNPSKFK